MFKKEEVLSNQDFVPFDKDAKAEEKAHDQKSNYAPSTVRAKSAVVRPRYRKLEEEQRIQADLEKIKSNLEKAEQRKLALRLKVLEKHEEQQQNMNYQPVYEKEYLERAFTYIDQKKQMRKKFADARIKGEQEGKLAPTTFKDLKELAMIKDEERYTYFENNREKLKKAKFQSDRAYERKWRD